VTECCGVSIRGNVVVSVCMRGRGGCQYVRRVWWYQYVRECGGVSMYERVWWCQYV
jgi:hypothetical protein